MKHLRLWLTVLLAWLVLLLRMEDVLQPVPIARFAGILAAGLAVCMILTPSLQRLSLPWLFVWPLLPFAILKLVLGYPIAGPALPITLTEICFIELTVILARETGRSIAEFQRAVSDTMMARLPAMFRPFQAEQSEMYREIRRARMYRRPLVLLAVTAHPESLRPALHRFIEEVQRVTLARYTAGRIAQLLSEEMKDCDIIAQRDDHFVVLIPETSRDSAGQLVAKLSAAAREKLGLALKLGLCSFPDQEVTFEKLLERAELEMRQSDAGPSVAAETARCAAAVGASNNAGAEREEETQVVSIRLQATDPAESAAIARAVAGLLLPGAQPGLSGPTADARDPADAQPK